MKRQTVFTLKKNNNKKQQQQKKKKQQKKTKKKKTTTTTTTKKQQQQNIALGSAVVNKHTSYSVCVKDFYFIYASKQQIYKSRSNNTELKQDEYSTAIPLLKRWSNRYPTVEPQWALPKTEHRAPTNCIEHFSPEPSLRLRHNPSAYN